MPDYIILSAYANNFNEISGYIYQKTNFKQIITGNKRSDIKKTNTIYKINGLSYSSLLHRIIDLPAKLDLRKSDNNNNSLADYIF